MRWALSQVDPCWLLFLTDISDVASGGVGGGRELMNQRIGVWQPPAPSGIAQFLCKLEQEHQATCGYRDSCCDAQQQPAIEPAVQWLAPIA